MVLPPSLTVRSMFIQGVLVAAAITVVVETVVGSKKTCKDSLQLM